MMLALCVGLAACGKRQPEIAAAPPLIPMPASSVPHDPGHELLMAEIAKYVAAVGGPQNSQFEFTRIDLDGDGRREGLVMMKNPHQFWCESYGCRLLVFRAHNDGFNVMSEIHPVRGPLTVSEKRNHGWRDIVVVVDGRSGWQRKMVALQFDGRAYPAQPAFVPATYAGDIMSDGVRIFP